MLEIDVKKLEEYLPVGKSEIIRMGALDLINGYSDIISYLDYQKDLGGDARALNRVVKVWDTNEAFDAGESGTIFRFVTLANLKFSMGREIITSGTLTKRSKEMYTGHDLLYLPPEELLTIDGRESGEERFTSQWATMAYLLGDRRKIQAPLINSQRLYHLRMTYDTNDYWEMQRKAGKVWEARSDRTIKNQAVAFAQMLVGVPVTYVPEQPEDFFFSVLHGFKTIEEALKEWPSVTGHETNRPKEVEQICFELAHNLPLTTMDHRGMQAGVMKQILAGQEARVVDKNVVNKTWPLFWDFLDYCKSNF